MGVLTSWDRETLEELIKVRKGPLPSGSINIGNLELLTDSPVLLVEGRDAKISQRIYDVLLPFFLNPGICISFEEFEEFYVDPQKNFSPENLRAVIYLSRKKVPELGGQIYSPMDGMYVLQLPNQASYVSQVKVGIGEDIVNFADRGIYRDGERIGLSPTEFSLLKGLILTPHSAMSYNDLINQLDRFRGLVLDYYLKKIITTNIFHIRAALGEDGDKIESIKGGGYRINPEAVTPFPRESAIITELAMMRSA